MQQIHIFTINIYRTIYKPALRFDTISQSIKSYEYAVRGAIAIRAMEIRKQMEQGVKFNFTETTPLNIGNPQELGQKPITYNREVLACILNENLCDEGFISRDAAERANGYLDSLPFRAAGAYTESAGMSLVKQEVKEYIEKRDDLETSADDIYLVNGASEGITTIIRLLISQSNDGIMIPNPQYPIYSALITKFKGQIVPYYLDEDQDWGLNVDNLEKAFQNAVDNGTNIKAIAIINPGNPTGQVLSQENLQDVLKFAHDKGIFVMADEVYQK